MNGGVQLLDLIIGQGVTVLFGVYFGVIQDLVSTKAKSVYKYMLRGDHCSNKKKRIRNIPHPISNPTDNCLIKKKGLDRDLFSL